MSHEKTWYRPPSLGPYPDEEEPLEAYLARLKDEEEEERQASNLVDDDGDEFYIPEGFDEDEDDFDDFDDDDDDNDNDNENDMEAAENDQLANVITNGSNGGSNGETPRTTENHSELERDAQHVSGPLEIGGSQGKSGEDDGGEEDSIAIAQERARMAALEEKREASRNAYLSKQRHLFSKDFTDMLDEKGIQPCSQWVNWIPKLEFDERFARVDVEDRARIFNEYRISLIGNEREMRKDRAKRSLRLLRRLRKGAPALVKSMQSACSSVAEQARFATARDILQRAVRPQPESEGLEPTTTLDEVGLTQARRALQALSVLVPADNKKVIATFLRNL
ncbi:Pre-mRNA-processing protein 40C [Hondaea fermentalgiana]|uniref:Pre-mRNA-processing protein 40C n=1 Tax=Hondaea fermentalgiana TaxID=2315210 RepID=A0A2R5H1R0_9STRA|nr:Pre-mRNA-processing protein 40C [Hondaea fermentalgiana]|eukprot:GBG34294.1 Pre-mRNA-processing protein 40C [Hondaea fermentalgiana]